MKTPYINSFKAFLQLEKGLSPASITAYLQDLRKLIEFIELQDLNKGLSQLELNDLQQFITYLNELV